MKDVNILRAACNAAVSDTKLQPVKDPNTGQVLTTFCNYGVMRIAHSMGCDELQSLTADDQYKVMDQNNSGKWVSVNGEIASICANRGQLVIAGMSSIMLGESHGHVTVCYPGPMEFSGSLNKLVPIVCNIGKNNAEEKESLAFPVAKGEPHYFAWNG